MGLLGRSCILRRLGLRVHLLERFARRRRHGEDEVGEGLRGQRAIGDVYDGRATGLDCGRSG